LQARDPAEPLHDLVQTHELLCDAVREAGELALGMSRMGVATWDKHDGTPVSDADLAVDKLLAARLGAAVPGAGWLSEETARSEATAGSDLVWIVDPIDGTSAFVAGTDHWCVGASLVQHGRPVLACAYAPAQQRFYEAVRGGGTRLNGAPLQVSATGDLEGARIIAHTSVLKATRWRSGLAPAMTCAMTTSLILRQCLVATGEYDLALAFGLKSDWDLAPGDLIVSEAGGSVRDLDGRLPVYNQTSTRQNGLMAGPAGLLDALSERLHSNG
jgi:myo-inositol-1(or 4)-monophosphatase